MAGGNPEEMNPNETIPNDTAMTPAVFDRDAIVRRFEAWLDDVLRCEEPPEGIAAELLAALESEEAQVPGAGSDLYSMQAAVTALTQEVKLQSRSYKQLNDTLAPVAELGPKVDALMAGYSDVVAELRCDAESRARAEILDALLDMRDRFARGLTSFRAATSNDQPRRSWLARLFSRSDRTYESAQDAAAALEKGYTLSLDRLDEILGQYHVSEISCAGREFDPASMNAVDTEETERVPEGTVLEVYRAGYEWNGEVYRIAQVKVARAPRVDGSMRNDGGGSDE
jgi:molecular chaperone GrpE (heat shock protein)